MLVVGVVRSKGPFHGRVFRGGCSRVEYQRIGAWRHRPFASTDAFLCGGCPGTWCGLFCWVVFGTLLGPEATGPWSVFFGGVPLGGAGRGVRGVGLVFLVSWLHRSCVVVLLCGGAGVWGVWFGVVV